MSKEKKIVIYIIFLVVVVIIAIWGFNKIKQANEIKELKAIAEKDYNSSSESIVIKELTEEEYEEEMKKQEAIEKAKSEDFYLKDEYGNYIKDENGLVIRNQNTVILDNIDE